MDEPVAEAEIEDRVNGESYDRHIIVALSYASSGDRDHGHSMMPII